MVLTVLETPHVIVGAAIATKVGNPLLAIPLAFTSHFILEKVPHWNPHLNTETEKYGKPTKKSTYIVIADSTLALLSGLVIAQQALPNLLSFLTILASSFVAVLPDLVEAPYFFLNLRSRKIRRWINFQKSLQVDAPFFPGILSQVAVILASLWWLAT